MWDFREELCRESFWLCFRSEEDSIVSSWVFGPYEGGTTATFGPYHSTVEGGDTGSAVSYGPYKNGTSVSYTFETTVETDNATSDTASQWDKLCGPYRNGTAFNFVTNKHYNTWLHVRP